MERKEELRQSIDAARNELWEIEARETEERNRALIGKCFIYRNCYSSPGGPQDYWWLCVKVIGVEDKSVRMWRFQTDKYGKVEVEPSTLCGQMGSGYKEIPLAEFNKAWEITLKSLNRL